MTLPSLRYYSLCLLSYLLSKNNTTFLKQLFSHANASSQTNQTYWDMSIGAKKTKKTKQRKSQPHRIVMKTNGIVLSDYEHPTVIMKSGISVAETSCFDLTIQKLEEWHTLPRHFSINWSVWCLRSKLFVAWPYLLAMCCVFFFAILPCRQRLLKFCSFLIKLYFHQKSRLRNHEIRHHSLKAPNWIMYLFTMYMQNLLTFVQCYSGESLIKIVG